MTESVYEALFLLDPNRYGRDGAGLQAKVEDKVRQEGLEIVLSRLWEERRLAYPIKGHRKGVYWLMYFRSNGQQLASLNRNCNIDDSILRQMFLKVDPRIVDTLVDHVSVQEKVSTESTSASGATEPAASQNTEEAASPATVEPAVVTDTEKGIEGKTDE